MRLKILLSVILFLVSLSLFSKDVFSAGSGNWNNQNTWVDGVIPSASDNVYIRHLVILNSTENISVQSIFISNSLGENASLDVRGEFQFNLTGSLIVDCRPATTEVLFLLSQKVKMIIAGDFYATRDAVLDFAKITISIFGNSSLHCQGNFTLDYNGFIALGQEHVEFSLSNNATMIVDGNTLFKNIGGDELLINFINRSSFSTFGDIVFQCEFGYSIRINITPNATMTAYADLNFNDLAAESKIDLYSDGEINILGNLNIFSAIDSTEINLNLNSASGLLKVQGDINFHATSEKSLEISMLNQSKLELEGSITKVGGFGSLSMSPDCEFVFLGSGQQSIQEGSGRDKLVFSNVTFDTGNDTISLLGNIVATKTVFLKSGIVKTSESALLILEAGASILGGSPTTYIDGPLRKIDPNPGDKFTFPIGYKGTYGPLTIDVISGRAAGFEYTASYTSCPPPWGIGLANNLNQISASEHWDLERSKAGQDINVELHWTDAEAQGINDISDLVVAMYNPDATIYTGFPEGWTSIGQGSYTGTTGSGASGSLMNIGTCPPPWGIQSFTFGSLSEANSLPVQMESFDATLQGEIVNIDWTTEDQANADYFEIQKSANGLDFQLLNKVQTKQIGDYSIRDLNPQVGINYYRIKQYDMDGMFAFTSVKSVTYQKNSEITAFPNPIQDQVVLKGSFLKEVQNFSISDINGKILQTGIIDGKDEYLQLSLDELNINGAGIFMLELFGNTQSETIRLVKH